ncbi:MAG: hypothetical protein ACFE7R_00935 [Candidatus Hodarchaeota archaeon]
MKLGDEIQNLPIILKNGERGHLVFSPDGPAAGHKKDTSFEPADSFFADKEIIVDTSGQNQFVESSHRFEIHGEPIVITMRPYLAGIGQAPEPFYPQSSGGWFGRAARLGEKAVFTVQEIANDSRKWLTISNAVTNSIYESHPVQPYEVGVLELPEHQEVLMAMNQASEPDNPQQIREDVLSILDNPPPTWDQIAEITTGVTIPNLKIGSNMRETMDRIVPRTFPSDVREELMAFLALVTEKTIPKEDPIDLQERISTTPVLGNLFMGHLQCIIDGIEPPPYARLMMLASIGRLEHPRLTPIEAIEVPPWRMFWYKTDEMFSSSKDRVIEFISQLNQVEKVPRGIPVTRASAKRSGIAWKDRFTVLSSKMFLRVRVNLNAIGLRQLLYLGAAHSWPHQHMAWTAQLESISESPTHVQLMVMPPSAAERVRRIRPSVMQVDWSARAVNLELFKETEERADFVVSKILNSITETRTIRSLIRRHGRQFKKHIHSITTEEAKVLDAASVSLELAFFEQPKILEYLGLTAKKIRSVLDQLRKEKVAEISYEVFERSLVSILVMIQGSSDRICAITDTFLRRAPTALAMLDSSIGTGIIMARLSEKAAYQLLTSLPTEGAEEGLAIRCFRPISRLTYTSNLFQRLLREDGTWNDDVSSLLAQARSMKHTVSQSNL